MKPQSPPWVCLAAGVVLPPAAAAVAVVAAAVAAAAAQHAVGDLLPLVGAGAVLVAAAGLIQSHRVVAADSSGPTNTNAWLCHKFCAQKCCICWVKSLLIIKK